MSRLSKLWQGQWKQRNNECTFLTQHLGNLLLVQSPIVKNHTKGCFVFIPKDRLTRPSKYPSNKLLTYQYKQNYKELLESKRCLKRCKKSETIPAMLLQYWTCGSWKSHLYSNMLQLHLFKYMYILTIMWRYTWNVRTTDNVIKRMCIKEMKLINQLHIYIYLDDQQAVNHVSIHSY